MDVNGISGSGGGMGPAAGVGIGGAGGRTESSRRPAAGGTAVGGAAVARGLAAPARPDGRMEVLGAEAPPGTDPALWRVLTTEERAFYARARAMGPLTYRPDAGVAAEGALARGGRVDLRV